MTKLSTEVAVIVPAYNNREDLPECIASICRQTCDDWRLYVVDDGSTDGTGEMLDALAARDPRIRVVHQANAGPAMAAIRGIQESTEPYLFFVDADDWIDADMLRAMTDKLRPEEPGQLVVCGYAIEKEYRKETRIVRNGAAPGEYTGEKLQREIRQRILGTEPRVISASRCMKVFDRRLLEDCRTWTDTSLRVGEDLSMVIPAVLKASRIVVMEDAFYHYRFRQSSAVHRYRTGMAREIAALDAAVGRLLDRELGQDLAPEVIAKMREQEYFVNYLVYIKNELRGGDGHKLLAQMQADQIQERYAKIAPELALEGGAARLIGWLMQRPNMLRIRILMAVFRLEAGWR